MKLFMRATDSSSIAKQLLHTVFAFYVIVTIIVTAAYMSFQYYHEKTRILDDFISLERTFSNALAKSLWDLNQEQLDNLMRGLIKLPHIVGVKIEEQHSQRILLSQGIIQNKNNRYINVSTNNKIYSLIEGIFQYNFPINYNYMHKKHLLGHVTLYSSRIEIFKLIGADYLWIIVNAIIKTIALWIIFLFVSHRLINQPLQHFTTAIKHIKPSNLSQFKVDIQSPVNNELTLLASEFNKVTVQLNEAQRQLYQQEQQQTEKLELLIEQRTTHLNQVIKQQNKTEIELKQAKEIADIANRTKSDFLANMSHEIRTPMNAILGFTDILINLIKEPSQQQYLSFIQSSGKSLLHLINDILDLSKVESGKLSLNYAPCSLHLLCKDIEHLFSHKAKEKGINFIVKYMPNLPDVIVIDEVRLRQILINLIGNALRFTHVGHITLILRAKYVKNNLLDIYIQVIDTGIGIPEQQQQHIFDAFQQQKQQNYNQYGGTGLGLAISKHLAEIMNGNLLLTSEVNKGSAFTLLLRDIEQGELIHSSINTAAPTSLENLITGHILVVDDVELNRLLIRGYLEDYPHIEITEATNGQEAIEYVHKNAFSLILMDIRMPVMDGHQATDILRKVEEFKDIPIIATTASVMKEKTEVLNQQFDGILAKPVQRDELFSILTQYLKITEAQKVTQENETPEPTVDNANDEEMMHIDTSQAYELYQAILPEIHPLWAEVCKTLTINDVEYLAEKISQLAIQYNYMPLISWSDRLKFQVIMFDMEAISASLNCFGELFENLKEHSQK